MTAATETLILQVDRSKLHPFLEMLKLFDFVQVQERPATGQEALGESATDDFEDNLSAAEIAEFHEAIAEADDPRNLISHHDAKQMLEQWLSRKR